MSEAVPGPWRTCWRDRRFRRQAGWTLFGLVIALGVLRAVLHHAEAREGVVLKDPVLAVLDPVAVHGTLFALTYAAVVIGGLALLPHPLRLLRTARAYSLLTACRALTLTLVPLGAPPATIPLHDPVVETFTSSAQPLTQDLFFSGHVATAVLLALAVDHRWLRWALFLAACVIAGLLLRQHVHYTIDVIAAPLFSAACWRVSRAAPRQPPPEKPARRRRSQRC